MDVKGCQQHRGCSAEEGRTGWSTARGHVDRRWMVVSMRGGVRKGAEEAPMSHTIFRTDSEVAGADGWSARLVLHGKRTLSK